eukprot:49553-Ditylum_brightwellii.AAC.1
MEYALIYAVSQGMTVITALHMGRRTMQLGGKHIAYLFDIPYGELNKTSRRRAELAIHKIMQNPVIYNLLQAIDGSLIDESAKASAEML